MFAPSTEAMQYENESINATIERLMSEVGIPRKLKGYAYLTLAVKLAYADPHVVTNVTAGLYREIAERHGTSVSCVERDMRTALKQVSRGGRLELIDEYVAALPQVGRSVTAQNFIAVFADKLRHNLIVSDHENIGGRA